MRSRKNHVAIISKANFIGIYYIINISISTHIYLFVIKYGSKNYSENLYHDHLTGLEIILQVLIKMVLLSRIWFSVRFKDMVSYYKIKLLALIVCMHPASQGQRFMSLSFIYLLFNITL